MFPVEESKRRKRGSRQGGRLPRPHRRSVARRRADRARFREAHRDKQRLQRLSLLEESGTDPGLRCPGSRVCFPVGFIRLLQHAKSGSRRHNGT